MNEAAITEYIRKTFAGVDVVVASRDNGAPEPSWGDTFFFYDPMGDLPADRRFPFATIVTKDYKGFDEASNLNRPGVFRLNIGVGRKTFQSLFGNGEAAVYDFTAFDQIIPHPLYGKMFWVSVLNPSEATFETKVKPLLQEAFQRAKTKSDK